VGKTGVADVNNPPILRRFPKDGGRQKKGNGEMPSWNLSRGKALRLDLLQAVRHKRCLVVQPKGTTLHLAPYRPRLCGCGVYCQHTEAGSPDPQQLEYPAVRGTEPGACDRVAS
jgi:hypothetical protein